MFKRFSFRVALVLIAWMVGGLAIAQAQSFNFSYTALGVSVSGTLITTSQGNNQYLINSIVNGTRGGNLITLLTPGSFHTNDNILTYPGFPTIDSSGFAFSSGGVSYDVFRGGNAYFETGNNDTNAANGFSVSPAPAPIPGAGLLSFLALGLVALGYCRRWIAAHGRAIVDLLTGREHHRLRLTRAKNPKLSKNAAGDLSSGRPWIIDYLGSSSQLLCS